MGNIGILRFMNLLQVGITLVAFIAVAVYILVACFSGVANLLLLLVWPQFSSLVVLFNSFIHMKNIRIPEIRTSVQSKRTRK